MWEVQMHNWAFSTGQSTNLCNLKIKKNKKVQIYNLKDKIFAIYLALAIPKVWFPFPPFINYISFTRFKIFCKFC